MYHQPPTRLFPPMTTEKPMPDPASGPNLQDVEALTGLLDMMENFPSNEQRARYLLTCNWMRDRDARLAGVSA